MANTGVLYGATGTFKTWNLGLLAKHIFAKTKKPVRWVTLDGGGYQPIQSFIDAGIIDILSLVNDQQRLLLISKIVEGYWPQDIEKGIRQSKKMLKPDYTNVGGYVFEGITSMAESIQNLYIGRSTGMKPAYSENIVSDLTDDNGKLISGATIGSFSMDSFGLTQSHMIRSINYSWTLPVPYIWWSGHDVVVNDDEGGQKKVVTGVGLVGQAATPRLGKNLGTMIHAYKVEVGEEVVNGKKERKLETRYYYQPHLDNILKGVSWEAKPRVPGDLMPKLLEKYKGNYFVPTYTEGLDSYVKLEEDLLEHYSNSIIEWKQKILSSNK